MHYKRRSRRKDKSRWAACGCCEIITSSKVPPIDDDRPSNGKARSKRVKPKKQRCLVNKTHEWYHEEVTRKSPRYRLDYTQRTGLRFAGYDDVQYHVSTCIHCWEIKEKRIYPAYLNEWRMRKTKKIPKRPVRF